MSKLQKAVSILAGICFAGWMVLGLGGFWRFPECQGLGGGDFLKSLPFYCFLERKAALPEEDSETMEKLLAANRAYLKERVLEENKIPNENETVQESGTEQGQCLNDEQKEGLSPGEEAGEENEAETVETALIPHPVLDLSPERLADYNYLLGQFFIVDPNTAASESQLNAAAFLEQDLSLTSDASKPQILIYHSHSQEGFVDSDLSDPQQRIVGVGSYLTQLLREKYGYHVIHVEEEFDVIDGEVDRARAYDFSQDYVSRVLEENPSIEVVIDLHRDGVPEDQHLVTEINGKPTARIMNFNGLSYTLANGPVDYLPNPYIQDNLAFSFQLIYQASLYYPELYRGIYLAGLRYNLQLRPKALLLEAGAQTNTLQEVKNAMEPFAAILDQVLQGPD